MDRHSWTVRLPGCFAFALDYLVDHELDLRRAGPDRGEMFAIDGVKPPSNASKEPVFGNIRHNNAVAYRDQPARATVRPMALALAGGAQAIVTHNLRDLRGGELRLGNLRVLTPAQCLEEWK